MVTLTLNLALHVWGTLEQIPQHDRESTEGLIYDAQKVLCASRTQKNTSQGDRHELERLSSYRKKNDACFYASFLLTFRPCSPGSPMSPFSPGWPVCPGAPWNKISNARLYKPSWKDLKFFDKWGTDSPSVHVPLVSRTSRPPPESTRHNREHV